MPMLRLLCNIRHFSVLGLSLRYRWIAFRPPIKHHEQLSLLIYVEVFTVLSTEKTIICHFLYMINMCSVIYGLDGAQAVKACGAEGKEENSILLLYLSGYIMLYRNILNNMYHREL